MSAHIATFRSVCVLLIVAFGLSACKGNINTKKTPNDSSNNTTILPPTTIKDPGAKGATIGGLKMLTRREYDLTITTLLGLDGGVGDVPQLEGKSLPMNGGAVFGNAFKQQKVSEVLVKGAGTFAEQLAQYVLTQPQIKAKVLPCTPSGADDETCYGQFIDAFSQRALRRPLDPDERTALMAMFEYGKAAKDFDVAMRYALEYFLQHAEFLYRNEQGQALASNTKLYKLNEFQIATRMAFALWGQGPDRWLLDRAKAGQLSDQKSRRAIAAKMLEDPRALKQIQYFHARWLGYDGIQLALPVDMRRESDLLIERVITAKNPDWRTLFTANGTYLTDELADHYKLPRPGTGEHTWVAYPAESGRAGIFSHGAFLSVRASVGKTSITHRGRFIAEHLLCLRIADPPPNIDTDERAPGIAEDACKQEEHEYLTDPDRAGLCASCHIQMDLVAMGLERFGPTGQYREYEEGLNDPSVPRQECKIKGEGQLPGLGSFSGPSQLGKLMVGEASNDVLASCAVRRAYQFAHGLDDEPISSPMTSYLLDVFKSSGYNWKAMLLAMVASEAFVHRRDELDPEGIYWNSKGVEAPVRDPKDVDVEYAMRYTEEAPTIDGNCQEFVGAPVISWTGLNETNNQGQDCWMTWSKGDDGTAMLNGCCTVRDQSVIAQHSGRATDHDFSDDGKPNIFRDDHFTYMLSSSGGVFDEATTQIVLTAASEPAIYDLFFNDGFFEGVVGNDPVVSAKGSVKKDAQGNAESWTVEYTARTRFKANPDEGLDILCRFRITDVDEQGGPLSHTMSFGDQNNITTHQELRACRLSTTRHKAVVPKQ